MKGFKVPFEIGPSGSFVLIEGEDKTKNLLMTALRDCVSLNAFQELGLDPPVFDINDETAKILVESKIREIFKFFQEEDRVKLADRGLTFEINSEKQELIVNIKYIDLEFDQVKSFTVITRGG